MPADLSRIPKDFYDAVESGNLPAERIGPLLDDHVANSLLAEIKAGRLPKAQALAIFEKIRAKQHTEQQNLERNAYHKGTFVHAPETAGSAGLTAGMALLPSKALSHITKNPMTWGQTAGFAFGPAALPLSSLFEVGSVGMAPFGDPLYQRGERDYFSSMADAAKSRVQQFEQAGKNTRERYGVWGAPIQALQNIYNPLTGVAFTGKELYKALNGPSAAELSMEAEKNLAKYLGD